MQKAIILLADGNYFEGLSFGATGTSIGEICFNTSMTGYQEILTDPSYTGQVLIMNHVHIGNYGVTTNNEESAGVTVKAVVAAQLEEIYSRNLANDSLQNYLLSNNVLGIHDVDTRALVAHVRQKGAMNCIVSNDGKTIDELKTLLNDAPSMDGMELASVVSTKEPYYFGNPEAKYKIAALDFGIKKNILQCFADRDVYVKVFPAQTNYETLCDFEPHGFFLSNGPGDPAPMNYAVSTVKQILKNNAPVFGICLGHQILALANGIPTFKMHHGHRGANHPVKNLITGKSEITTQNHGFGVDPESIAKNDNIEITHVNLNDNSIEGFRIKDKPAFSVQYHPEASPGPHDSKYLFDNFIKSLNRNKSYII